MTKSQAINLFKREILPEVIKKYGKNDLPAIRTAFNDFTDTLCKNGDLTPLQYATITLTRSNLD
jgi:hypothetical protein